MLCQKCMQNDATIHMTQVVNHVKEVSGLSFPEDTLEKLRSTVHGIWPLCYTRVGYRRLMVPP
jgi:hypothetical protein